MTKSRKHDLTRVLIWVALALAFNAGIYFFWPARNVAHQKALEFFTGYIIEYSLSVDNLFVFIMIFRYFGVSGTQQHRALNWGIIGAIIFRMLFVFFGVAAIHLFHEVIYIFGAILIFSAYKMAFGRDREVEPNKILIVHWFRKIMPVTEGYIGDQFFVKRIGGLMATPLLLVVLVVESSDIMFAVDSIPAILAITQDPMIVITSNIFAILGLRSLYFLLADSMELFRFLKHGVALILAFVGIKMLIMDLYKVPTSLSLILIVVILLVAILASRIIKPKQVE
ncbi:MAG: TerC/Alx family metal homeostasis membrane protein [bacterium]|nr:TerC/Alx family metal homeostasis membrane protein [bacterium]